MATPKPQSLPFILRLAELKKAARNLIGQILILVDLRGQTFVFFCV